MYIFFIIFSVLCDHWNHRSPRNQPRHAGNWASGRHDRFCCCSHSDWTPSYRQRRYLLRHGDSIRARNELRFLQDTKRRKHERFNNCRKISRYFSKIIFWNNCLSASNPLEPCYYHSFVITENWIILNETPMRLHVGEMIPAKAKGHGVAK